MTVGAKALISIWAPFDAYVIAETTQGMFSLFLDGSIRPGIQPLATGIPRLDAPVAVTFVRGLPCPSGLTGAIRLYLVITHAGRVPPVRNPAEVRADSLYVIILDTKTLTIMP